MKEDKATSEKIELWLDGMLSKEETHAFEAQMDTDPELRHKVAIHRRARLEIEEAIYLDFRKNATIWHNDLDNLPLPPPDLDVPANSCIAWIKRIIIGMLLFFLLPIIPGPSSESFKSDPLVITKATFGNSGAGTFGDETISKNDPSSLESEISSLKNYFNRHNNLIGNEIVHLLPFLQTSFNIDTSMTVTRDSFYLINNSAGVDSTILSLERPSAALAPASKRGGDSTVLSLEPIQIKQKDLNQAIPDFPPLKIKKVTIAIAPFTYSKDSVSLVDAKAINKQVLDYITGYGHLTVVRGSDLQYINVERELQKGEDFIDGRTLQQGANMGAEFMLVGHVVANSGDEGPVIHISIVDVATGQIKASEIISSNTRHSVSVKNSIDDNMINLYKKTGLWKNTGQSQDAILKAFSNSIFTENPLKKQVKGFIDEQFPLRIGITLFDEIDEKSGVKTILLFANEKTGLKKGDNFIIVEASQIINPDGTTGIREKEIGKAKVVYFEENFTYCKVLNGGKYLVEKQGNTNVYLVKIK